YAPLPIYAGYTGRGVKLSNSEGLDPNHDDFWNHDAAGVRTTPRWPLLSAGWAFGSEHGTMTAGIMLGNGWRSTANGGTPWQWRGMAPEAIYTGPGSGEDAQNMSFAHTDGSYNSHAAFVDMLIRGDGLPTQFHPIVYAVGNNGIEIIH